jgi:hypothetical protein
MLTLRKLYATPCRLLLENSSPWSSIALSRVALLSQEFNSLVTTTLLARATLISPRTRIFFSVHPLVA